MLKGETINLDKQIDCIYYDAMFYVIKKGNFERIVGLQEEYKTEAKNVVEQLKQTGKIDGLDKIENQIETTPSLHKKLVRRARRRKPIFRLSKRKQDAARPIPKPFAQTFHPIPY